MNQQRSESYLKVIAVLDSEGGVTLRPDEASILRHAADVLFFDEEGRSEAMDAAKEVTDRLVDSERWSEERADRLSSDLDGCGALVGV
jgi:hypothetical protein